MKQMYSYCNETMYMQIQNKWAKKRMQNIQSACPKSAGC